MSRFDGEWKFKSTDNFDEYMKALGVSFPLRKMGNSAKPTVTMKVDESTFYYKSHSIFRTLETKCKINEEWDEEAPDGRKCKSIIFWEGESLVHIQKWDGKETRIVRSVDAQGDLVIICTMGDVSSKRVYSKA